MEFLSFETSFHLRVDACSSLLAHKYVSSKVRSQDTISVGAKGNNFKVDPCAGLDVAIVSKPARLRVKVSGSSKGQRIVCPTNNAPSS